MVGIRNLAAAAVLILSTGLAAAGSVTTESALKERILGDAKAPITIIEYASMTCPACRAFHVDVLPKLKKNFIDTGKARIVFRDFPIDQAALIAAVMARCVRPDLYFKFVNLIFEKQPQWTRSENPLDSLLRLGKLAGLSRARFDSCIKNRALVDGILQKQLDGEKNFGVTRTPTFIINNDHKLVGTEPYEEFEKILKSKVK